MSKKTLIIIIAVLAVILLAGIVAIFVLPDPAAPNTGDDLISSEPAQTGEPAQQPGVENVPTATDDTGAETVADPTQKPDATAPTKNPAKPTDPTKPINSQKPTDPTKPTKPQPTEPKPTEPTEPGPLIPGMEEVEVPDSDKVTYEEYYAMSADEQASFINSFESIDAFFAWHTKAKEEYENARIEIDGSTPIDLEEILGGN